MPWAEGSGGSAVTGSANSTLGRQAPGHRLIVQPPTGPPMVRARAPAGRLSRRGGWAARRGRIAVTVKGDFPEDEWARVVRAPFVAGLAISLADPGGPIEAAKESMATIRSATNPPSREQLLAEVALDLQAQTQARHNPLKGYKPTGTPAPGEQVLAELGEVQAHRCRPGDARGGSSLRAVAGRDGAGRGRRGEGGRLPRIRRRAGQRTGAGHARTGACSRLGMKPGSR